MSDEVVPTGAGLVFRDPLPGPEELRRGGWPVVLALAGERVHDPVGLIEALAAAFPLDPPVGGGDGMSWDALADSLFEGIHASGLDRVALVWRAADVMRLRSPRAFLLAVDVLCQTVETIAEARYTAGRPTELLVLIEGLDPR